MKALYRISTVAAAAENDYLDAAEDEYNRLNAEQGAEGDVTRLRRCGCVPAHAFARSADPLHNTEWKGPVDFAALEDPKESKSEATIGRTQDNGAKGKARFCTLRSHEDPQRRNGARATHPGKGSEQNWCAA